MATENETETSVRPTSTRSQHASIRDPAFSDSDSAENTRNHKSPGTRIAMRHRTDEKTLSPLHTRESFSKIPETSDTDAVLDMASVESVEEESHVTRQAMVLEVVPMPATGTSMSGLTRPVVDFIEPIIAAPSCFNATGHLAMTHGGNGAMAGTAIPPAVSVQKVWNSQQNPVGSEENKTISDSSTSAPPTNSRTSRSRSGRVRAAEEKKMQNSLAMFTTTDGGNRMFVNGAFGQAPRTFSKP